MTDARRRCPQRHPYSPQRQALRLAGTTCHSNTPSNRCKRVLLSAYKAGLPLFVTFVSHKIRPNYWTFWAAADPLNRGGGGKTQVRDMLRGCSAQRTDVVRGTAYSAKACQIIHKIVRNHRSAVRAQPAWAPLMSESLDKFVRQRCPQLGLSMSELGRRAILSCQTLYELSRLPARLPSLTTVVALAQVLEAHPMRLLHCVFEMVPVMPAHRRAMAGDSSAFVGNGSYPDGAVVAPRQRFEKVWTLQNVGTVAWRGRSLECQDDSVTLMDATSSRILVEPGLRAEQHRVPLPDTEPGATVPVGVWFGAPAQPCTVISSQKMVDAFGRMCFPDNTGAWVMGGVMGLTAAAIA